MSRTEMRYSRKEMIDSIASMLKPEARADGSRWLEQLDVSSLKQLMEKTADQIDLFYRQFATARQRAATNRAHELLMIFRHSGLKSPSPTNEVALDQMFPGPTLSLENFRSYVQQNPDVARQRFEWATEPFAQIVRAEQQQGQQAVRDRQVFGAVCKALAVKGLANVANVDANYSIIQRHLGSGFSVADVTNLILRGDLEFEFAPNSNQIVRDWIDEAALKERRALAVEIANDYSQDEETRQQVFDRLMPPPFPLERLREMGDSAELRKAVGHNSTYETTEQLRARAHEIRARRALRKQSVEQVRAVVAADAQQRRDALNPVLPDSITAQAIRDAKPQQLRKWLQFYGQELLNQRLQGRG